MRRYGRSAHMALGCALAAVWSILAAFVGIGWFTGLLLLAGAGVMAAAYALDTTDPRPLPDELTAGHFTPKAVTAAPAVPELEAVPAAGPSPWPRPPRPRPSPGR